MARRFVEGLTAQRLASTDLLLDADGATTIAKAVTDVGSEAGGLMARSTRVVRIAKRVDGLTEQSPQVQRRIVAALLRQDDPLRLAEAYKASTLRVLTAADVSRRTLDQLATNVDEVVRTSRTAEAVRMTARRFGVNLDIRYADDGEALLRRVADEDVTNVKTGEVVDEPATLSKGQLGEKLAHVRIRDEIQQALRRTDDPACPSVRQCFLKGYDAETNTPGPDLVYQDPATGEFVVTEAKFLSESGNFGKGNLGRTKDGRVTQMSEEWLRDVVEEVRGISQTTEQKFERGLAAGSVRRNIRFAQNAERNGKTITESIAGLGIDKVTIYKIGEQR